MEKYNGSYIPSNVEKDLYSFWEENKYFVADNEDTRPSYTIVLPPPNVTGILHIGHALNISIQDSIIRHRRMSGYNTLWIPGTDHAGIATQNKVERMLQDEGTSKEEIGMEEFLKRTWQWKEKYGNIITKQFRKIGASLDWTREKFTMDSDINEAVNEVFVRLYNDDLIYRGEYIVNWCPKDKTALADDEIDHIESDSFIWHIKYPIKDSNEYLIIATTRPETMLGDSAVAVNGEDPRYTHLKGKKVILPLVNREIPIIEDSYVDMEFGTGAVKMTPSHDPNDFEVGKRHNLEFINIFTEDAKINELGNEYEGLDRFVARKKIVEDLDNLGLLEKVEAHKNSVGHCYRCGSVIESRVSKQWFVRMEPLAKKAIKVVEDGQIELSPKRMEKIYFNWLNNIRDWCISRQIWWGHRIPAFYDENDNLYVARNLEEAQKLAGEDKKLRQDNDVLDTWFSSSLWPFTTLGWPEETLDLKTFFPTTSLITGADIVFFWVARMIMMSLYVKDEIPFKKVYFNGIVRDEIGRKMSKSLGNSPDPLDLIANKGADSLRFSLLFNTSPGLDIRFSESLVDMGSNFMNKIWNASKFCLSNLSDFDYNTQIDENNLKLEDKWILSRLNRMSKEIDENMNSYEINDAIKKAFEFFKGDFCDWYLEIAKTRIYNSTDLEDKKVAQYVLRHTLDNSLRLLHPFIPYITEYIWQDVKVSGDTLMLQEFPKGDMKYIDDEIESKFSFLQEIISSVRNIRAEANVSPAKKIHLIFKTNSDVEKNILLENPKILDKLSNIEKIETDVTVPELVGFRVVLNTEIYVPLMDLIDKKAEIEKIENEINKTNKELQRVVSKLSNEKFMEKAPSDVIEKERRIEKELNDKLDKLRQNLKKFN
ncbi:valine--tRNA ligase [Oceanivirga miroungae]|uniref:Valine--tRNA ligase n=1 Tax=Oceanivirga miroungae TaxID=1130046 RepID=A0A6I8MED1_9FUSO|nr:valine--tRNA ligase [Oceanivirga miroungae]VWL85827.1 valyl-tRNA synthetase [Oceanivirga miroungae]